MDQKKKNDAWEDFSYRLTEHEAAPFFDRIFDEMAYFYRTLDYPNGPSLNNFWAWSYDQLQAARSRVIDIEEEKRAQRFREWNQKL